MNGELTVANRAQGGAVFSLKLAADNLLTEDNGSDL